MLQAYSLNVTVASDTAIPFNNQSIKKGCTAELNGVSTIELNKCGVYMVSCDCSSTASATIQLFKDGVALSQAQSTGTAPNFTCLVQVDKNNSCCACSSPALLQVINVGDADATFTDANIVVTKLC